MSIKENSDGTENRNSGGSETTEQADGALRSHFQQGGRHYLVDPATGDQVTVARLTVYAEVGEEIHGKDAHHEIPLLKIDAPRFLDALTREEHMGYHQPDPDPVEVDGFPLFRAEP